MEWSSCMNHPQLDSDNPSHIQQAQGFMLSVWLCRSAADGRLGSNIYEVKPWLWQFGCCKTRLGDLSIEQTTERKDAVSDALHQRAAETEGHRKAAPA